MRELTTVSWWWNTLSSFEERIPPFTVAADNGFQDWHTEYEIAALNIDYLVHYRGSTAKATAIDIPSLPLQLR